MEIQKPNDIFAASLQKEDLNLLDLAKSNITLENTQLLSPDEYKKLDKIQNMFTKSGVFDEDAFNKQYLQAANLMHEMSLGDVISKAVEYDPFDYGSPFKSKKIDVAPIISPDFNPNENKYSWEGVNTLTEGTLSQRELAQKGRIYDIKKGEFLDKSANDLNLFQKFFGDTLVYAQWDEDGVSVDPITGREISHRKGEWKYDENGNYYTEFLAGREVYTKQIVNPLDILTKDGGRLNRVDFFDSDGREKSTIGTTMKLFAEIAPYLIPTFNTYYGGMKMATMLAGVLPTFYKAGEGLLLGERADGVETDLWRIMNSTEGYLKKYSDKSFSDKSAGSMWNYEQIGSIVTDVFSQIYQQRAAASLSKLFYKVDDEASLLKIQEKALAKFKELPHLGKGINTEAQAKAAAEAAFRHIHKTDETMKAMSDLSRKLSVGYMAMIQSGEVYSEALEAGFDRRTAGWTSLLAAAGQFKLMSNNELGSWFLDSTVGYTEGESKAAIRKLARSIYKDASEGIKAFETDKLAGKAMLANTFRKFKNGIENIIIDPISHSSLAENLWKKAVIEGIEEVSEEVVIDMAKGVADVMSYLGFTEKKGSFGGFSNAFSSEGLQRYLSQLVGGMIGGPMFELERSVISPLITTKSLPKDVQFTVYDAVINGKTDELLNLIEKEKGSWGSTTLSPIVTKVGDNTVHLPTDEISQADLMAAVAKSHVKLIDNIINLENLGNSDDEILTKAMLDQVKISDIMRTGIDKFILSDAKELGLDIVELRDRLNTLSNTEEGKNSQEYKETLDKLNNKRQEYTDIATGKNEDYYHQLALFTLNPEYHSYALSLSPEEYVLNKYGKVYEDLSEVDKTQYTEEFKKLMEQTEGDFKNKMKAMFDSFKLMSKEFSKPLKNYADDGYADVRSKVFKTFNKLGKDGYVDWELEFSKLNEMNRELMERGHTKYNLDTNIQLDMAKFLIDNGYVTIVGDEQHFEEAFNRHFDKLKETFDLEDGITWKEAQNEIKEHINSLENTEQLYNTIDAIYNKVFANEKLDEKHIALLESEGINIVKDTINDTYNTKENLEILNEYLDEKQDYIEHTLASDLFNKRNIFQNYVNDINSMPIPDEMREPVELFIKSLGIPMTGVGSIDIDNLIKKNIPSYIKMLEDVVAGVENEEGSDDETKKLFQEELKKEKEIISNLNSITKVDDDLLNISAKRELLLNYGKSLLEDPSAGVDSEFIKELKLEIQEMENIFSKYPSKLSINPDRISNAGANMADKIDEMKNMLNKLEPKAKINSLLEQLEKFEFSLLGFKDSESFFKILRDNISDFNNNVELKSDFIRSDQQIKLIERAQYTLNAIDAVLSSMNTTTLEDGELYGMNIIMNKYLEQQGKSPEYEFVDSNSAEIIKTDINIIRSKIDYLLNLAKNNAQSLVDNDNKIKDAFIKGITSQYLDKNNKISLINLTINDIRLFSDDDLEEIDNITNEEQKLIEIESIFYTNFHKAKGSTIDKLNSLFSHFIDAENKSKSIRDIIESIDSTLTSDFTRLELGDWYNWIHGLLAVNSKKVYSQYKDIVNNSLSLSDEFKKAPLYTQLVALRQAMGYIENKNIMAHTSDFILNSTEKGTYDLDSDEKVIRVVENAKNEPRIKISNIFSMRGSGGVGKSSVLANNIIRLITTKKLLGNNVEFLSVAPTDSTLKTLTKELKGDMDVNIDNFNINELLKKFINDEGIKKLNRATEIISKTNTDILNIGPEIDNFNKTLKEEGLSEYFIKVDGTGAIIVTDKFYQDFKRPLDSKKNTVIIGDEAGKINTLEWQILDKISSNDNVHTILLMDELQSGVFIGENLFSVENIFTPWTVKLRNPIRSRNSLQSANNVTLEKWVYQMKLKYAFKHDIKLYEPEIYYNDAEGSFLTGTKVVNEILEKDLEKFDKSKQIAVITTDGKLSKELNDKLKSVFGNTLENITVHSMDVQGMEFDQTIIDVDLGNQHDYNKSRDIYTLLTRAKEGALVKFTNGLPINNEYRGNSKSYSISKDIIQRAIDDAIKRLNELDLEYEEIEKSKEVIEKPEEEVGDVPELQKRRSLTPDEEILKDPPVEEGKEENFVVFDESGKPDQNKAIGYSFFNNIGISDIDAQSEPVIKEYLDYTIIGEGDTAGEKRITWKDLKEKLEDHLTGTDLFAFPKIDTTGTKLSKIISDYIKFKNEILFTKNIKTKSFYGNNNIVYASDSYPNWVLKRIYDKNSNKYIRPYGKLVKSDPHSNNVYAIGAYVKSDTSSEIFITLAVTPNIENVNVSNSIDTDILEKLYNEIDSDSNHKNEVLINKASIHTYKTPVIPIDRTDANNPKMSKITGVNISDIETMFPGMTIVDNEVKVFRGNTTFIKDEFSKYGVDLKPGHASRYTYRPYIIVEYLENSDSHRRLIVLNSKTNEFKDIWEKWLSVADGKNSKGDPVDVEKIPKYSIISRYRAWQVLFDYLTYVKSNSPENLKDVIESVRNSWENLHQSIYHPWKNAEIVFNSLENYNFAQIDDNFKNDDDFKKWYNNTGVVEKIVTDKQNYTKTKEYQLGNPLVWLRGFENNDKTLFKEFLDVYKKPIYAAPTIISISKAEKGAGYGVLPKNEHSQYTINIPVESNRIYIDMKELSITKNKKGKKSAKKAPGNNNVTSDLSKVTKSFTIKEVPVWTVSDGELEHKKGDVRDININDLEFDLSKINPTTMDVKTARQNFIDMADAQAINALSTMLDLLALTVFIDENINELIYDTRDGDFDTDKYMELGTYEEKLEYIEQFTVQNYLKNKIYNPENYNNSVKKAKDGKTDKMTYEYANRSIAKNIYIDAESVEDHIVKCTIF